MRITLTSSLSLLCLLGGMLLTEITLAKTYKWVDENGVTQYTATPPPTDNFEIIKAPAKPTVDPVKAQSDIDQRIDALNKRTKDATKAQAKADAAATKKTNAKKKCQSAKKNLHVLQTKIRIRYTKKDGSIQFQTDSERKALIKRAEEMIKSFCK